jgi:tetratricopeptide (TPR) repeat protein
VVASRSGRRRRGQASIVLVAAVVGLAAAPRPLSARYAIPDLVDLPLDRLIANLERAIDEQPEGFGAVHALARAHAMAYAWELGMEDQVEATQPALHPFFSPGGPHVPWAARDQEGDAPPSEARRHLDEAIRLYRRAVELDAGHPTTALTARLGLAWCLGEAGEAEEARTLLRAIVREAADAQLEHGFQLGTILASEAIDYLVPLLDPQENRAECLELRELRKELESLPRAITPIAVALRPDVGPVGLVDREARVAFDLDGSGALREWQWISPAVAWLAWAPDGATVDRGIQLFGSRSFGLFLEDGYAALALLDDDGDGWLRRGELDDLVLWRDADRDGRSDDGEVRSLRAAGVVGLRCAGERHASGLLYAPGGVELQSGEVRASFDLVLESRPRGEGESQPVSSDWMVEGQRTLE